MLTDLLQKQEESAFRNYLNIPFKWNYEMILLYFWRWIMSIDSADMNLMQIDANLMQYCESVDKLLATIVNTLSGLHSV